MRYNLLLFAVALASCQPQTKTPTPEQIEAWKSEVRQVEADFAAMAAAEGVPAAFLHFAAEDAVLSRNNATIKGKAAIQAYFDKQTLRDVKLSWSPDFVDVSVSGDLAYTYGPYSFSAMAPDSSAIESEGIFHTVWKRQEDGTWKYVWD